MVLHLVENRKRAVFIRYAKRCAPYLMEFLGTFFLTLTVELCNGNVLNGVSAGSLAPFAIGWMLSVMVYSGGRISGGHYNPAVTFSILCSGQDNAMTFVKFLMYMIMQVLGGIAGAVTGYGMNLKRNIQPGYINEGMTRADSVAFVAEVCYTFALCFVVLNCAVSKTQIIDNSFFGFCIGTTVLVGAITVGDLSGAVFNPAVATGLFISNAAAGGDSMDEWYIYYLAEFVGAFLAASVFSITNCEEYSDDFIESLSKVEESSKKTGVSTNPMQM